MNAEQLLAMAFPDEPQSENGAVFDGEPRLELVKNPDPATAWAELQMMLQIIPGLELRTDGDGGVWLRPLKDWRLFGKAQRLFLAAMPEIAKSLPQSEPERPKRHPARVTPHMVRTWRTARTWIFAHHAALVAAGWTSRGLFAAGRKAYPHGAWGVAWASIWMRPGGKASMDGSAIVWTWMEGTMTRTQTANPR